MNMKNETWNLQNIKRVLLNSAVYILMVIVIVIYASLSDLFLSAANIKALLTNSSTLLVAAVGIAFVLMVGEIDLSIGSVAGFVGMTWVVLQANYEVNVVLATIIALLVGALMGVLNGFLIVYLKINSFLVTLGMQMCLRGMIYLSSGGNQVMVPSDVKKAFLPSNFGGISPLIIISISIAVIMMLVYKFTPLGRKIQATGCNAKAAKKIGISVSKTKCIVFIMCSFLAGIAGILQVVNVGTASPAMLGLDLEFLAITAAVLGGVSLLGGIGTIVPGVLVGAIFLMAIENGLGLLGANPYAYPVVRGIVIYMAMFSDSLKRSLNVKMQK